MKNVLAIVGYILGAAMLGHGIAGFYHECFLTATTPAQIAVSWAVMAIGTFGAAFVLWMGIAAAVKSTPNNAKGFVPFVLFAVAAAVIATAAWANKAPAAPIAHTTINRAELMEAEEDSGDSELPLVRFVNAVGNTTRWNELSMDEQAVRVKLAGLIIEEIGKATPKNPITGGFMHGFLRQVGVQMQIQAMHHLDEISPNPLLAAAQGFLVGM